LDVVLRLGGRPICNGCDAFGIHCNTVGGNDETEKPGFRDVEFALLELDIQFAFLEAFENFSDTLDVFFEGAAGIDEDVVHIRNAEYI